MRYYLLLDLEATCCNDGSIPKLDTEIIEIGAMVIDQDLNIISTFSELIRPVHYPVLHSFCTELTSITQEDVDLADTFDLVSKRFSDWVSKYSPVWYGSWGMYDKRHLDRESEKFFVSNPVGLMPHINLKHAFSVCTGIKKGKGMRKAMRIVRIEFEGTQHRAMIDVDNMLRIIKAQGNMREYFLTL